MIAYVLSRLLGIECLFMLPKYRHLLSGRGFLGQRLHCRHLHHVDGRRALALSNPKKAIYAPGRFCGSRPRLDSLMSLFGCLPFYISGYIPHFVDAFFEIVSASLPLGPPS